jgi:hypothetical protein
MTLILLGYSTNQEVKTNISNPNAFQQKYIEKPQFILKEVNNCKQSQLSNQFALTIDFKRYTDTLNRLDSCFLTVYVNDKKTMCLLDSFSLSSLFYYSFMFLSCDSFASYSTNFNVKRSIADDNYFGDIVVADLNFDRLDDIAVINDTGGSTGGPLYSFYIQTNEGRFVIDRFLTDTLATFPSVFDSKSKTITTYVNFAACKSSERICKFDAQRNSWIIQSHKITDFCEDE